MDRTCEYCGKPYQSKRDDSKFCSTTCRVKNSRTASVNQEGEVNSVPEKKLEIEEEIFEFTVAVKPNIVRTAKYWYNVPLGALPVMQEGWPDMPQYMHGRQYFLWWKNGFETDEVGPVIIDPSAPPEIVKVTLKELKSWGA